MKKLPLAIAMVSLLTASTGFSSQYYNQDFKVSLDIPSSIDVSAFQQEIVQLSMEDLTDASNSDGVLVGSVNITTNSYNCYATITTDNDFKLAGPSGSLPYVLDYIATNSKHYITGEQGLINTQFSANDNTTDQKVGCDTADLKMHLSGVDPINMTTTDGKMLAGAYNDVIHVEVRTDL